MLTPPAHAHLYISIYIGYIYIHPYSLAIQYPSHMLDPLNRCLCCTLRNISHYSHWDGSLRGAIILSMSYPLPAPMGVRTAAPPRTPPPAHTSRATRVWLSPVAIFPYITHPRACIASVRARSPPYIPDIAGRALGSRPWGDAAGRAGLGGAWASCWGGSALPCLAFPCNVCPPSRPTPARPRKKVIGIKGASCGGQPARERLRSGPGAGEGGQGEGAGGHMRTGGGGASCLKWEKIK